MQNVSYDDKRWAVARTKFGLIAPVVNGTYPDKTKSAYFKRMEGTPVTFEDGSVRYIKAPTIAEWHRKYMQGGLDALLPKERSDSSTFRALDSEVETEIMRLHEEYPHMPTTLIYENLIQRGIITRADVSLSTLQRFARKNFYTKDIDQQKERRAFEAATINGIWQADTLYGPFVKEDGKRRRAFLQTIIDDKSRLIVGSCFVDSDDAKNFQLLLKRAVMTYGIPARLYADHGGPYENAQLSCICANIGCVLMHAPIRDGAAKGKIERLNRTIRQRFLSTMPDDLDIGLEELNERYTRWVHTYNTTIHTSLKKCPLDVWSEEAKSVRRIDMDKADSLFRNRVVRTVTNASTIRLNKVDYDVAQGHTHEKAYISYTPDDIHDVWISFNGGPEERIYPTNYVMNGKTTHKHQTYRIQY